MDRIDAERAFLWTIALVSGFLTSFYSIGGEGGSLKLELLCGGLFVLTGAALYFHYRRWPPR